MVAVIWLDYIWRLASATYEDGDLDKEMYIQIVNEAGQPPLLIDRLFEGESITFEENQIAASELNQIAINR